MDGSASITLPWGDSDHSFRLGIGQWRKVQDRCDAGPAEIAGRLLHAANALAQGFTMRQAVALGVAGAWRVDDVREPILQGLIGGGMSEVHAAQLVRDRVDERTLKESIALAFAIVMAGLAGPEDEPTSGEPSGGATPTASPEASSGSASSMAQASPPG